MKNQIELKDCTFKPQITTVKSSKNMTDKLGAMFESSAKRAPNNGRGSRQDKFIKSSNGKSVSQFKSVRSESQDSSGSSNQPAGSSSTNHTFERLYQESKKRQQLLEQNKVYKQQMEEKGCTFQPNASIHRDSSPGNYQSVGGKLQSPGKEQVHQRLYNEQKLREQKRKQEIEEMNRFYLKASKGAAFSQQNSNDKGESENAGSHCTSDFL